MLPNKVYHLEEDFNQGLTMFRGRSRLQEGSRVLRPLYWPSRTEEEVIGSTGTIARGARMGSTGVSTDQPARGQPTVHELTGEFLLGKRHRAEALMYAIPMNGIDMSRGESVLGEEVSSH